MVTDSHNECQLIYLVNRYNKSCTIFPNMACIVQLFVCLYCSLFFSKIIFFYGYLKLASLFFSHRFTRLRAETQASLHYGV